MKKKDENSMLSILFSNKKANSDTNSVTICKDTELTKTECELQS